MELFTSIPTKVTRMVRGEDFGSIWTRACVNSWLEAGFEVVSLNAPAEAAEIRLQYPEVRVHEVARDGTARKGRPLVYVADLIGAMAASPHGSAALANADVMFMAGAGDLLRDWEPDGFAFSNRLDIQDIAGTGPSLHGGVDFMVVNVRHLTDLPVPDFLFGTPWWDYWLPLSLAGRGVVGHKLDMNGFPVITHLAHDERWRPDDFTENFSVFLKAMAEMVDQRGLHPRELHDLDQGTGLPGPLLRIGLELAKASSAMIHSIMPRLPLVATPSPQVEPSPGLARLP